MKLRNVDLTILRIQISDATKETSNTSEEVTVVQEGEANRMQAKNVIVVVVLFGLIMTLGGPVIMASASDVTWSNSGPYVDEIVYNFMQTSDEIVLALMNDEIDMSGRMIDPNHLDTLIADPDIEVDTRLRNGYGHITINCQKYPFNISAFRRAFAFAFDKTRVTNEVLDGLSIEHDSLVPEVNPWCVEDQFTYHYYTDQTEDKN